METYLRIKKNRDTDEWMVIWIEGGKRNEEKTYYTDDLDDAVFTALNMQDRHDIEIIKATGKALKRLNKILIERCAPVGF